ncbi:hypothetical protein [Spongiactinospora rosea]|uniref:hypothetical protein n=1 Tax=Spongiactinospora rosea TaxID=2248750 RepID=UPI0011C047E4|nr:hypothetical protein [Spongiactinospora rosea]
MLEAGAHHARSAAVVAGRLPLGVEAGCAARVAGGGRVRCLIGLAHRRAVAGPGSVRPEVGGALFLLAGERRAVADGRRRRGGVCCCASGVWVRRWWRWAGLWEQSGDSYRAVPGAEHDCRTGSSGE